MSLISLKGTGIPSEERLVFSVEGETNIGHYVVLQTMGDIDTIYSETYNSFWFPDFTLTSGDYAILYTKAGEYKTKVRAAGGNSHSFYWNKEKPIWDSASVGAALCHISKYQKFLTVPLLSNDDADD